MDPAIQEWCEAAQTTDCGRRALVNLIFDFRHDHLSPAVVCEFLKLVAAEWAGRVDPNEEADRAIARARDKPAPSFLCRGQPLPEDSDEFARVMLARDFIDFHINAATGVTDSGERVSDLDLRRLSSPGGLRDAHGELRTVRPLAWVTSRPAIQLPLDNQAAATRLRNGLGLLHIDKGKQLIVLFYPAGRRKHARFVVPTSIEGYQSPAYRSAEGPEGWGRALDLETLSDGLPEAIHQPLSVTPEFTVRSVGEVGDVPALPDLTSVLYNIKADLSVFEELEWDG